MSMDVVIPNYNRTEYLKRAVLSALSQALVSKIIIVDDGSNQSTIHYYEEILKLSDSIVVLYRPHTGDPGENRNLGVEHSTQDWIAFLDSDDYWEQGRFREIEHTLTNSNIDFYCSNARTEFESGLRTNDIYFPNHPNREFKLRDLMEENIVITSTVIVKRSVLMAAGGFPTGNSVRNCEDFSTWLRIATIGKSFFDSTPRVVYTISESSYSRNRGVNLENKAFLNLVAWTWTSGLSTNQKLTTTIRVFWVITVRLLRQIKMKFRIFARLLPNTDTSV